MHRAVRRCQVARAALAAQFRAATLLPSRSVPIPHQEEVSNVGPVPNVDSVISTAHDSSPAAGITDAIADTTRVALAASTIGAAIATAAASVIAVGAAATSNVTAVAAAAAAAADASPTVANSPTAALAGDRTVGEAASDIVAISTPADGVGAALAVSTPDGKAVFRFPQGATGGPQALMIL